MQEESGSKTRPLRVCVLRLNMKAPDRSKPGARLRTSTQRATTRPDRPPLAPFVVPPHGSFREGSGNARSIDITQDKPQTPETWASRRQPASNSGNDGLPACVRCRDHDQPMRSAAPCRKSSRPGLKARQQVIEAKRGGRSLQRRGARGLSQWLPVADIPTNRRRARDEKGAPLHSCTGSCWGTWQRRPYSHSISSWVACALRPARALNCARWDHADWSILGASMMSPPASISAPICLRRFTR